MSLLGILFEFLTLGWVSWGRSPDPGRGKPESPLQRPLISLKDHPLTSTDRKLKLNSQGRGSRIQRPQKWGVGSGEPEASTFSFAAAESAVADYWCVWGGPSAVLHPLLETPMGLHPYPCPRARVSLRQPPPSAALESQLQVEPLTHIPLSSPKVSKVLEAPDPAGLNFPTPCRPPLSLLLPPRNLIKIGFLQSLSAHSKPHAPPHRQTPKRGKEVRV